jgi:hypothetical protein
VTDEPWRALRSIIERLDALGIAYMVVGSVAALAHGRSRTTQDADIVADLDERKLRAFVESLPSERFYVSLDAALDALRRKTLFNVIDLESGWKIDLVPRKRRPFSLEEFARRQSVQVAGLPLSVASAEDTILSKLEWAKLSGGSARQLEDAEELARVAAGGLDMAYIERWAEALGVSEAWSAIRARVTRGG